MTCLFSSSTRKVVFGRASITTPSNTITSFLFMHLCLKEFIILKKIKKDKFICDLIVTVCANLRSSVQRVHDLCVFRLSSGVLELSHA